MSQNYTGAIIIDVSSTDQVLSRPCQAIYCGDATPHDICVDIAGIKAAEIFISGVNGTTGAITAVTIGYPGQGYLAAPTLTLSGGSGTSGALTAVLTGDKVTSVTISTPGTGYTLGAFPTKVTATGGRSTGTVIKNVPVGILPISVSKIYKTSTNAANLLALYI